MSADPKQARSPSASVGNESAREGTLAAGTRFGEFEIIRVIAAGDFGIVYLAHDHSLERRVALQEYLPAALAKRGEGRWLTLRAGPSVARHSVAGRSVDKASAAEHSVAETYAIGLRSFMNEARLLARFDHPSLVKVYRFWEENATAYRVMPFLQGITLGDARRAMTRAPDEAWIRSVIDPVLDALGLLHRQGVCHRDIAPDNIMLPSEGPPVLLDFGAARRVVSDRMQSPTAGPKPGYAAIEQYAETSPSWRQGPWTDLYALGAVVHYLLFNAPPEPAVARALVDDAGPAMARRRVPGVSPRMLETVAWMLAVSPLDRPQDVATVKARLNGETTSFAGTQQADEPDATGAGVAAAPKFRWNDLRPRRETIGRLVAGATLALLLAAGLLWQFVELLGAGRHSAAVMASSAQTRVASPPTGAALAAQLQSAARRTPLPVAVAANSAVASAASVMPVAMSTSASAGGASALPAATSAADVARRVALSASPASASAASGPGRGRASKLARSDSGSGSRTVDPLSVALSEGRSPAAAVEPADPATGTGRSAAPAPAVPAEPASAREACGSRIFLALALCMERECEAPRYRGSSECASVIEMKRNREARYQ